MDARHARPERKKSLKIKRRGKGVLINIVIPAQELSSMMKVPSWMDLTSGKTVNLIFF